MHSSKGDSGKSPITLQKLKIITKGIRNGRCASVKSINLFHATAQRRHEELVKPEEFKASRCVVAPLREPSFCFKPHYSLNFLIKTSTAAQSG